MAAVTFRFLYICISGSEKQNAVIEKRYQAMFSKNYSFPSTPRPMNVLLSQYLIQEVHCCKVSESGYTPL